MGKEFITSSIRKLRFLNDEMTQQQLADAVSVSRQTIVAIEKDKYSPSLELAFRIAHVFEKPFNEVFQYNASVDPVWAKIKKKKK
ncbi:MAG: helix-turn-helix transcriptional regulator [Prolixibacteraceae bacterium]|jgi:putative transcriptional regulator|nr:helix-turn-helix transcriptional regulator [Prolixibacteraceae bacterium]